jgi:predicted DNA-binding transcriptional regulator YafY
MRHSDHSKLFWLFHRAVINRRQIVCVYQGYNREFCPIILGHKDGRERLLAFQFAGGSSKGPVRGKWKCFNLGEIENAKTRRGRWHSGGKDRAPQSCLDEVFVDVNTEIKNQPGRTSVILAKLNLK